MPDIDLGKLSHAEKDALIRSPLPLVGQLQAALTDLGAQFRSWTWSPNPGRSQRMRWNTGLARQAIRFSTEQATLASVFWAGRVRARRRLPMTVL